MRLPWKRKRRRGFGLIEVMAASTLMAGLQSGNYQNVMDRTRGVQCMSNLRQIGMILMTQGQLPNAAFYPKGNPRTDPKSIVVLMKGQVPAEMFVCPTSPPQLASKGLTFLWNDKLSGKNPMMAGRQWVMIEMNCLAEHPVAPHQGKYHVLYTDSTVREVRNPPREILAALARARQQQPKAKQPAPAARKTPPAPAPSPPEKIPLVKGSTVLIQNLNSPLFLDKKVIANLNPGQAVVVLDVRGDWVGVKVQVGDVWKSGWIRKSDVAQ